jgi:hypothetical protein
VSCQIEITPAARREIRALLLQQRNSTWRVVPFDEMRYWDLELAALSNAFLLPKIGSHG